MPKHLETKKYRIVPFNWPVPLGAEMPSYVCPSAPVPLRALRAYRLYFASNISDHWRDTDPGVRYRLTARYIAVR